MKITTILMDVGWPIIDESVITTVWYDQLKGLIKDKTGIVLTDSMLAEAETAGVNCYAPSLFSYIIWHVVRPDIKAFYDIQAEFHRFYSRREFRLQTGIREVLDRLAGRFRLGLAANQPVEVYDFLKGERILDYFDSTQVSGEIGFSKPDIRMFLAVLQNLGAKPEEALMVGDRQDNDIVPAKLIGMTAVRLLVGPHRIQPVRYPPEAPDYTIDRIGELPDLPMLV